MTETVTAKLKYLRIPPRKARLVVDLIRGLKIDEAEAHLMLSPRRVSEPLLKLLRSAVANAKNNAKLEVEKLYIKEVRVDKGPKFKRWTPRARGSASPIEKKMSHVTLILGVKEKAAPLRFKIQEKPKKVKKETSKKEKKPKEKEPIIPSQESKKSDSVAKAATKPSFFRKIFRRKSI